MTKPTGNPPGRPRKFDENAAVLRGESASAKRSAMSEIAAALAQLGASNKGEIDIHEVDQQRTEWYVDTIDAGGFTVPGLRAIVGPGKYQLDIFEVGQDGRRKKIRRVACNLRPVPGSSPPTAAAAAVPGAQDMTVAAQAVAMMSSAMKGVGEAFTAMASHRGPDTLEVIKALAPILGGGRHNGASEAKEFVALFREGMTVGRENSGASGPLEKAIDAVTPLVDRIGKRIERDEQRQLTAGSNGAAPAPADARDLSLEEVIAQVAPFIRMRLARGVPPQEIAPRVLEDLYDLVGPDMWAQLQQLAGTPPLFASTMLQHLEPAVGTQYRDGLARVIEAARLELVKLAAQDASSETQETTVG